MVMVLAPKKVEKVVAKAPKVAKPVETPAEKAAVEKVATE